LVVRWDIHPTEVRDVLDRTRSVASEFPNYLNVIQQSMQRAGVESSSGLVASALNGFSQARRVDVEFVMSHLGSAFRGTSAAVAAYLQGDHEMVRHAQERVAAALDRPEPPPWSAP
jgi:hypothetical protein